MSSFPRHRLAFVEIGEGLPSITLFAEVEAGHAWIFASAGDGETQSDRFFLRDGSWFRAERDPRVEWPRTFPTTPDVIGLDMLTYLGVLRIPDDIIRASSILSEAVRASVPLMTAAVIMDS